MNFGRSALASKIFLAAARRGATEGQRPNPRLCSFVAMRCYYVAQQQQGNASYASICYETALFLSSFRGFPVSYSLLSHCAVASSNLRKLSTFRASRQKILNRRRPKEEYCMDKNSETTDTKPAGIPKKDAPQAFREIAEKGPTQANETYEKMNAATSEAVAVIEISYSSAVKGMQDY